jgi:hypothetical protein
MQSASKACRTRLLLRACEMGTFDSWTKLQQIIIIHWHSTKVAQTSSRWL